MLCLGTAPCANALAVERLSALPNAQCKIAQNRAYSRGCIMVIIIVLLLYIIIVLF